MASSSRTYGSVFDIASPSPCSRRVHQTTEQSKDASQSELFRFLDGPTVPAPFRAISAGLRTALTTTEATYPRTVNLFETASGQFPFDTNSTLFSGRLDHSFNAKDSGYARFNVGKSRFENNAAGALTAVSRGRTAKAFTGGALLSETHFFGPTTLNELKAQYSYLASDFIPNDLIGP